MLIMRERGISFIICTYNGSARLPLAIAGVSTQVPGEGESNQLIVVDNASTDESALVAIGIWSELGAPFRIDIVREAKPGLMNARVAGVGAAARDLIVFVDDDNILQGQWCGILRNVFNSRPNVGAIGGMGIAGFDHAPPRWFHAFQGFYACGAQSDVDGVISRSGNALYGAGLAMRTEIVVRLMEFASSFILSGRNGSVQMAGDDTEICRRLQIMGHELYYTSQLKFIHNMPSSRLTEKRLIEMLEGGGRAFFALSMLHNEVCGHSIGVRFKRIIWLTKKLLRAALGYGIEARMWRAFFSGMRKSPSSRMLP